MISTELRQELLSATAQLPSYQSQALGNFDWIGELEKISIKFNLTKEQEYIVVTESGMALLEVSDPKEMIPEIVRRSGLTEEVVVKIASDVIERIAMRMQKEIEAVLGGMAPEIRAKLLQELSEQETLASTGLVLTDNAAVATTDTVASSDIKATMPAATGVAHYGSDPYHESVE